MTTVKVLSREAILARPAVELERELVEVPEWGGSVYVQQFRGSDTDAIAEMVDKVDPRTKRKVTRAGLRPYILIRAVVDENGNRVFNHNDIPFLAGQPVKVTNRIIEVLTRLNGGDDLEEEYAENFDDDPSEDSPSS